MEKHSVSILDEEKRIGLCSICGETKVYKKKQPTYKNGFRWICIFRKRQGHGKYSYSCDDAKNNFVLTPKERNAIIENANSICDICKEYTEYPVIDHCHSTGRVRGVLCPAHNTALGLFKDNPVHLRAAATYLA